MTKHICTQRGKDFEVRKEAVAGEQLVLWTNGPNDLKVGEIVSLDGVDLARVIRSTGERVALWVF